MDANKTTTLTTPIQFLWEEIKMKNRPFTYNLLLEAEKVQRELIINTFNDGTLYEEREWNDNPSKNSAGEDYYNENFD
jgi:hypothetical protein